MIKKISYIGVITLLISSIFSCEKDFTDINSNIIDNKEFSVADTIIEVSVTSKNVASVIADNINGSPDLYWLGVFNNSDYKKIESSIISKVGYLNGSELLKEELKDNQSVITKIDATVLTIPYISTNTDTKNGKITYRIDSIIGDSKIPTNIKVYRNKSFLQKLNSKFPAKDTIYRSNDSYEKGILLNSNPNFKLTIPLNETTKDTVYYFDRNLKIQQDSIVRDSIKISVKDKGIPFMAIPLNKDKIKTILVDKFDSNEFSNKINFEEYFNGLIIESSGDNGFMVPFKGNSSMLLQIIATNYIVDSNNNLVSTKKKVISFPLQGIKNSHYKTQLNNNDTDNNFPIQGLAGSIGEIDILNENLIQELRSKNWLINDASLTFYIDKSKDSTLTPRNLLLYRASSNQQIEGVQIPDLMNDGFAGFGGKLLYKDNLKDSYNFRITQYITDVLNNETTYSKLKLKVKTSTDIPNAKNINDTIVKNYNSNPRAVWLLNEKSANGDRRLKLKISYSKRK